MRHSLLLLLVLTLALLAAADVRAYTQDEDELDVEDEDESAFEPPPRTPAPTSSASNRDAHPTIVAVRALRNAAMKRSDARDYPGAITKLREALTQMHERVFGQGRLEVTDKAELSQDAALYAQLLGDYGNVLIRAKQLDEAIDVLEDAVAMTEKIFGPSHPSLGLSLRSLAEAYMGNGDARAAIKKYKTLRKHVRLGLGEQHEAYVEASLRIAEGYRKLGEHDKAVAALRKMLRAQGEHVNGLTKGIGEAYMELSTAQLATGGIDEALRSAETARLIFRERDGEDSLAYAFSLNALAGAKMRLGEVAAAYELLQQAHRIALALFGAGDAIVEASAKTLREVRGRLDEMEAGTTRDEL